MSSRRWAIVASIVAGALAAAVGASAATTPAPLTPEQQRARAKLAAWVVPWDHDRTLATLQAQQRQIGRISPYWFQLSADGRSVVTRDAAPDKAILKLARTNDIRVVPTIGNDLDGRRVGRMLATAPLRTRHVGQLVKIADRADYAGIDVDYENLAADDRAAFTSFVKQLAKALHTKHKTLSVSVFAATADTTGDDAALATDYAAIGKVADEVRLLAYDRHWSCSTAGPVAPIDWVEDSIRHVVGMVPRRKVVLGIPLYGYDWKTTGSGCGKSFTWRDVTRLKMRHKGAYAWSMQWKSRALRYTAGDTKHVVWFEDAASAKAKAKLATEYELRGVVLWRVGGEDPQTWPTLVASLGADPDA